MSSLDAVVRELRWSAARSSAVQYLQHAVLAAMGWVLVVLLAGRIVPLEQAIRIAAFGIPVVFAAVAIAWIMARPRPMKLMRTADSSLGLKERLSTAWERRFESGPMDGSLRQDALRHAASVRLATAFPIGLRRGETVLMIAIALIAIALFVLPNPMDQVLSQRRADRLAQTQAAEKIKAVEKRLAVPAA